MRNGVLAPLQPWSKQEMLLSTFSSSDEHFSVIVCVQVRSLYGWQLLIQLFGLKSKGVLSLSSTSGCL